MRSFIHGARGLNELAGADRRCMAYDRDQVTLTPRLDAQDTEPVVRIVEGDPLDETREVLACRAKRRMLVAAPDDRHDWLDRGLFQTCSCKAEVAMILPLLDGITRSPLSPAASGLTHVSIARRVCDFGFWASRSDQLHRDRPHQEAADPLGGGVMIEILPESDGNLLAVMAHGEITHEDYIQVLIPRLEKIIDQHGKARLLYAFADDFTGFTLVPCGMTAPSASPISRPSTRSPWSPTRGDSGAVTMFGPLMSGVVRLFPAGEWTAAVPGSAVRLTEPFGQTVLHEADRGAVCSVEQRCQAGSTSR